MSSITYLLFLLLPFTLHSTKDNKMTNTIIKELNSTNTDTMILQYLAQEPKVKSEKKKAIILLHGVGSNEQDLFSLANQLPEDFFVISPRGQFTLGAGRYAWYQVDFSTGKPVFNAQQELSSREAIRKFIAQVKQKYNLDEVYLGGFSQGAIMSYSIGLTNPAEVKGIISLSGRLLDEVRPLINKGNEVQQLRVFVAHGIQDNTLQIQYARDAKLFIESLKVPLSYHEYQMGHQINGDVLNDLKSWLSNQ
jgi:phospholipase/carboxylesterase